MKTGGKQRAIQNIARWRSLRRFRENRRSDLLPLRNNRASSIKRTARRLRQRRGNKASRSARPPPPCTPSLYRTARAGVLTAVSMRPRKDKRAFTQERYKHIFAFEADISAQREQHLPTAAVMMTQSHFSRQCRNLPQCGGDADQRGQTKLGVRSREAPDKHRLPRTEIGGNKIGGRRVKGYYSRALARIYTSNIDSNRERAAILSHRDCPERR